MALRLSLIAVIRGYSLVAVHALLIKVASPVVERRPSSCGAWAQLPRGTWDLPRPGMQPVSPALAGGFLTTGTPGKSCLWSLLFKNLAYESRKGQKFSTMNKYYILTLKKLKWKV